ncbi:MAG TPA: PKD domain-containing protein [Bacteroidia bacterium]|nr:PKD domain-containing protein [Bacteroidia bacterium]HRS58097.1 PKD domain-containing protein [Bacteroidia bacterium]HRU66882.1 PKD domain-containing protein [Bacteroidia bacterium]
MINTVLVFLLLSVNLFWGFSQNIIPNPSFESYSSCPNDWNQCEKATGWKKAKENIDSRFTTEYLNACGASGFQVPNNVWGYQYAASGQAYMATATLSTSIKTDYRENMYAQLIYPVKTGDKLFVSFKICLTNKTRYASNNFGLKFSANTNFLIDNKSEIYAQNIVFDSINWTTVSAFITATDDWKFIAFGNFFEDSKTMYQEVNNNVSGGHCVYYVDDLLGIKLDFVYNNVCLGDFTSFIPINTVYIDSVIWDFGDINNPSGNISRNIRAYHKYNQVGKYHVKLVIYIRGKSTVIEKDIEVVNKPKAKFIIGDSVQCLNNNLFSFINYSTTSIGTLEYYWDFGDGGFSYTKHPKHNYLKPGQYTVTLKCSDNLGCSDSSKKVVVVLPQPIAEFKILTLNHCLDSNTFQFVNLTTNNNSYFKSLWNFGDGKTDTTLNSLHHYSSSGLFRVRLIATSPQGCSDTSEKFIEVFELPNVQIDVNDSEQCLDGNLFIFKDSHYNTDDSSVYYWDFSDKTFDNKHITQHSYRNSGNYLVRVDVISKRGCRNQDSQMVLVFHKPSSVFIVNDSIQCFDSNFFIFENKSKSFYGKFNSYWDFGDSSTSFSELNASHQYKKMGQFSVVLIVKDSNNCLDTSVKTVIVDSSPVILEINSNSPVCEGETIRLTSKSNSHTNYYWEGPNNFSSNLQNPEIEYAELKNTGLYSLVLKSGQCYSQKKKIFIHVNKLPVFWLGNDTFICYSEIKLKSNIKGEYFWNTGSKDNEITISDSGIYQLTIIDSNGCKYSDSIKISWYCPVIIYIPNAFSPNDDGVNDFFKCFTENIPYFEIKIFNRWGELLFYSNSSDNPWDGKFKGEYCSPGYYYYNVFYRENIGGSLKLIYGLLLLVR